MTGFAMMALPFAPVAAGAGMVSLAQALIALAGAVVLGYCGFATADDHSARMAQGRDGG